MSSRPIPTTPPDMTAILIPIVQAALTAPEKAGRKRTNDARFVQVRADLQGNATALSRYCRVGLTAWHLDSAGDSRTDLAHTMNAKAARAILDSRDTAIIASEWQAGPVETLDTTSQKEVSYITLLLEVKSNL